MNSKKITLLVSLFFTLLLLFISISQKPIISGTISKIEFNQNLVVLKINNSEILIFDSYINLRENDFVQVFGKSEDNNKSTIIADRIIKK